MLFDLYKANDTTSHSSFADDSNPSSLKRSLSPSPLYDHDTADHETSDYNVDKALLLPLSVLMIDKTDMVLDTGEVVLLNKHATGTTNGSFLATKLENSHGNSTATVLSSMNQTDGINTDVTEATSSTIGGAIISTPSSSTESSIVSDNSLKKCQIMSTYDPYKRRAKKRQSKKLFNSSPTAPIVFNNAIVFYTLDKMPSEIQKYWYQRYSYFSKYDEGILMDHEGWFSVTPELIAQHIAERCRSDIVIDAFCGCGGNAIQFASTCQRVIAIDIDPVKLHCARHNAKIYGVEDRIEFILGNFYELAPFLKADVVFLSPPWGGPPYHKAKVYNLKTMMPGNGMSIFKLASRITPNIAFFIPKTTNLHQLALLAGRGNFYEIERNYLGGTLKALTAYYGDYLPNCGNQQELASIPSGRPQLENNDET
ncbi:RNA cap guanine-N2 methyltransferase-domain-containing protein [Absidia repens]|uniref:Trimethylguanosine synthase n=1 Tax=Absidia repens TaxID=90262 RepID=A0A1X2I767_9FUNG|nr:RNA cap guanine-N2 methyltransferase-domain-containing protein [Absidia repens]